MPVYHMFAKMELCLRIKRSLARYKLAVISVDQHSEDGRRGANRTPVLRFGGEETAIVLLSCGMRRESQTHLDRFRRPAPDSFGQPHKMERVAEFESASSGWKPEARPLYQTRKMVAYLSNDLSRFSDLEISRLYKNRPRACAVR